MNEEFDNQYHIIYCHPIYCEECEECIKKIYEFGILKKLDLLIIQNISVDNKCGSYLSMDNIISLVGNRCKIIKIPICSFSGYFPQHMSNPRICYAMKDCPLGLFPAGDVNVDKMYADGLSKEEILDKINNYNFYSEEMVTECINNNMVRLENLKISDYIKDHYNERRLFYSVLHPSSDVLKELTNRILNYIGFSALSQDAKASYELSEGCEFVYPCVEKIIFKKSLNLSYYLIRIPKNDVVKIDTNKAYDLNEFVSLFLDLCYYNYDPKLRKIE